MQRSGQWCGMTQQPTFQEALAGRVETMIDACTRCGKCVEACPINVRIRQGIIKSDKMCLSAPTSEPQTWDALRSFQTFEGSPAMGKVRR